MILRAAAVLVLLGLYHLAGVHGFIAYILDDSRVYTFDRLVQSAVAVALFLLALPPSRSRYVHREELRGIWEAIEEFDRDLRAVRRNGGSYARACHAGIGRVRSAVYRLAWILRGSPTPETMDSREACRRMWRPSPTAPPLGPAPEVLDPGTHLRDEIPALLEANPGYRLPTARECGFPYPEARP